MSSRDKTGTDDETPETGRDAHTPHEATGPEETAADALQDGPQADETKPYSDIEDAELVAGPDTGPPAGDTPLVASGGMEGTGDSAPVATGDAGDAGLADAASDATTDGAAAPGDAGAAPDTTTAAAADPVPPASPPSDAPAQKSGGGFFPAALGGLVAAGLGFGAAFYLGEGMGGDDPVQQAIAQQSDRLAALEERLDTRLSALSDALAAAPASDVGPQLDALGDRLSGQVDGGIGAVADRLGGLDTRLAALTERLGAVENRPLTESSEAAQQAFAAYERDIEALRAALAAQEATNQTLTARIEERTAEAQAQVEAAAERAAELQKQAEDQARVAAEQAQARTRAAAVREALVGLDAALETGAPFTRYVDVLSDSAEVPEALAAAAVSGVTALPDLRDGFPALARAALDASVRETVDDGIADRAVAFLRAQTGVRSLAPRDGDDPDAILSRAEAALADGDLSTTLSELGQLPPSGQQVMADWRAKAEQRLAVTEAADTLADTLLAN